MSHYISVEDAQNLILRHVRPVMRQERLTLSQAAGRVLAEPIDATLDSPPYARAAMDGYAFRAADTPGTLHVVGTLYAGEIWSKALKAGQALRIMTGAAVPDGVDTVLEQERVEEGENIAVLQSVAPGRNIMAQGHEYRTGSRVLNAHTRLTPIRLGQLAALGLQHVSVLAKPRVLLLITGDEVQPGGQELRPGHIYDANGPMLQALLAAQGIHATVRRVGDQAKRLVRALEQAKKDRYDMVMTTGGVSVGRRDFLPDILEQHFQRLFWRVNMHPGKAMAAGVLDQGIPILALSGNPGATLTAWHLIVAPATAHLLNQSYRLMPVAGRLREPYPKPTRETRYLKAKFDTSTGDVWFDVMSNQSSDALSSFAEADGLVVIPSGSPPQPQGQVLTGLRFPDHWA